MDYSILVQIKFALSHLLFPFLMLFAGIYDVITFRIPNWLNLTGLIGFLLAYAIILPPFEIFLWSVLGAAIVLSVGFLLFSYNLVGAGDVKLATVCSLWLGFGALLSFVLLFTILGGILGIFILFFRRLPIPLFFHRFKLVKKLLNLDKLPYGLAIAISAIAVYFGYFGYSPSVFIVSI